MPRTEVRGVKSSSLLHETDAKYEPKFRPRKHDIDVFLKGRVNRLFFHRLRLGE
jgi:hypothetical protein